jgi:hypothetical protein
MVIKIQSPAVVTITPDFDGNLELEESNRLQIELARPSQVELARKLAVVSADGEAQVDSIGYVLAHVKRIINAPTLEIDGQRRAMVKDDLRRFDALAELYSAIQTEVMERFVGKDTGAATKNS